MRTHTLRLSLIVILAASFVGTAVTRAETTAPQIAPVTITVNTLNDVIDPADGKCSLREALQSAFNGDNKPVNECPASGGNTLVKFASAGTLVVKNALGGMPDTRNGVTLQGPITFDAAALQTILFDVESSGRLNLINVTIKNAKWTAIDSRGTLNIAGGKFENNSAGGAGGGAIRNDGTALIAGVSFKANKAVQKDANEGTKAGGAIRTTWVLTVTASTFDANVSDAEGGAIAFIAGRMEIADSAFNANVTKGTPAELDHGGDGGQFGEGGGAISLRANGNTYPVTVKRSTFSANVALEGSGGAISHNGGTLLTIQDSTFQANHAGSPGKLGSGGAVRNVDTMTIKRSMFVANSVTGAGGALANDLGGQLKLRLVGIAGNNASAEGGGIANLNLTGSEAKIDAIGVTINGNVAGSAGGGIYSHDSKYDVASFRMSVFAGNLPQNCRDKSTSDENTADPDDEEVWPIESKGQNSFSDTSCDKPESGDEQNADPKLAPPALNDGAIPSLLSQQPLPDSPLVDKIAPGAMPQDPDLESDKDARGMPRPVDGNGDGVVAFDIGPIERDEVRPKFSSLPTKSGAINIGIGAVNTIFTKTQALRLFNTGDAILTIANVSLTGNQASWFTFTPIAALLNPGGAQSVAIGCTPASASVGTATLAFNTNDTESPAVTYSLQCTGAAGSQAGFATSPPIGTVLTENTVVGSPDPFSVLVQNTGNALLTLSNATFTATPAGSIALNSVFPIGVSAGASAAVQFTCAGDSPGLKTGQLTFTTNAPAQPAVTFTVTCVVDKVPDAVFGSHTSSAALGATAGPYGISVSPDGRHAYAADEGDSAIHLFDLSQNTLAPTQTYASAVLAASAQFTSPLQVAVSPDGENVYATGLAGDAIVTYRRNNEDGTLTWIDSVRNGDCVRRGVNLVCLETLNGLNGAYGIAFSQDGRFVYVTGINNDSVVVFRRNQTNGALGHVQTFLNANLNGPYGIAISPDGNFAYVANYVGNRVTVLKRDGLSGQLALAGGIDASTVPALSGVFRVIVSADGGFVYTASYTGDAVCAFQRDLLDGNLTSIGCQINGNGLITSLDAASDIAISPDGELLIASSSRKQCGAGVCAQPKDGQADVPRRAGEPGRPRQPAKTRWPARRGVCWQWPHVGHWQQRRRARVDRAQ